MLTTATLEQLHTWIASLEIGFANGLMPHSEYQKLKAVVVAELQHRAAGGRS